MCWKFYIHLQPYSWPLNDFTQRVGTNLQEGEVVVDEHGETPHRNDQELHPEAVVVAVIGGPELDVDQVDRGVRTADVDHLRGADDREGLVTVRWRERCRGGGELAAERLQPAASPSCMCCTGRWTKWADPSSVWWTLWRTRSGSSRRYLEGERQQAGSTTADAGATSDWSEAFLLNEQWHLLETCWVFIWKIWNLKKQLQNTSRIILPPLD